jgi:predicted DNA binding CopG/RHH family protein
MAEKKKRKSGRPKVLAPGLDTRFQIRCSEKDVELWKERAVAAGFGDASTWIRKVISDALKQPVR